MLLNEVCQLVHEVSTLRRGQVLPRGVLEGLAGSLDGEIDIFGSSSVHGGDLGLVTVQCETRPGLQGVWCSLRWVNRDDLLAGLGLHKLVVNEETKGLGVLAPIGGRQLDREVRHSDIGAVEASSASKGGSERSKGGLPESGSSTTAQAEEE